MAKEGELTTSASHWRAARGLGCDAAPREVARIVNQSLVEVVIFLYMLNLVVYCVSYCERHSQLRRAKSRTLNGRSVVAIRESLGLLIRRSWSTHRKKSQSSPSVPCAMEEEALEIVKQSGSPNAAKAHIKKYLRRKFELAETRAAERVGLL